MPTFRECAIELKTPAVAGIEGCTRRFTNVESIQQGRPNENRAQFFLLRFSRFAAFCLRLYSSSLTASRLVAPF